jgi:predicted dehydrogenase
MEGSPVRVGIVGTGFGRRVMGPVFEGTDGVEVADVVTARDPDAVRALCARSDVDLVSIQSPPFLHRQHVGMAVAAGKAVLCDKPFGRSAAEATAMADEAEAAGVVNLVNFQFRHERARLRMAEIIDAGTIGTVEHVHWTHFHGGSRTPLMKYGWLFEREPGGGWVRAFGSHAIDGLRHLCGDIAEVTGVLRTNVAERPDDGAMRKVDAEDGFTAWFRMATGATALLDTDFAAVVTIPSRITVFGSAGILEDLADERLTLRLPGGSDEEIDVQNPPGEPYLAAMRVWAGAVRDAVSSGRQIAPSFRDGVACAVVMDSLQPPTDDSRRSA